MTATGRHALVTGAGSGIGQAFARALARQGHRVLVADIDESSAARTAAAIDAEGGDALAITCDVTNDEDVGQLAAHASGINLEVLVHCPGIAVVGPPVSIPINLWTQVFDVNLFGAVRVVNAVVPAMLERGKGRVVLISSIAGLMPVGERNAAYASSKAALNSFGESLRSHARRYGVTITLVCPGPVRTNISERITVVGPPDVTPINPHAGVPMLSPDEVARMGLEAAQHDEFLVLTHGNFSDELVQRAREMEVIADAAVSGTRSHS